MSYTIKEYNCESGKTTERDMTADEIKDYDKMAADVKIKKQAEADKAAAKASAQAKLAALGLTEDEVTAIIGA